MFSRYIDNFDFKSRFRILKGGKISLIVSALLGSTIIASAAPTAGVVTSGTATISQSGNVTNINQSTSKASINWQGFSINSNETVNFNQPNVNSITLNRVVGNERSIIDGALNANGQVWILNSNGVLFNKNAKVNTAGLVATTKNISDADFQAGNYKFSGDSSASVVNMGTIEASDNGYVALLANKVSNDGTIKAYKGTVHLTGASEATINLNGNSIVSLTVNKGVLDALVENKGAVIAEGGKIYLTTNAVDEILKGVVNNTGVLEANSIDDIAGKVELFAHGGTANVSGTIEAKGGFIETSGKNVKIVESTKIKAKEWLIDPTDITIESSGSTSDLTGSSIKASFIQSTLNGGTGVTLTADNDINVNEAISWNQSLLTLSAGNNININSVMSATGTAALTMNTGVSGVINMGMNTDKTAFIGKINYSSSGPLIINADTYTVIADRSGLEAINTALSGKYVLGTDIDLSGNNWTPIGSNNNVFNGTFNGLGHTISNMTIDNANTVNSYQGLFGYVLNGAVENIQVKDASIITNAIDDSTFGNGVLAGVIDALNGNTKIYNTITSGTITSRRGAMFTGGSFGGISSQSNTDSVDIKNSYSHVNINGSATSYVGGFTGSVYGYNITISDSGASGDLIASVQQEYMGGFTGYADAINNGNMLFDRVYSTCYVNGSSADNVGGLIGFATNGVTINKSYAKGNIFGKNNVGGLVGNAEATTITDSFSNTGIGMVDPAVENIGGLVGILNNSSTITNSSALGYINLYQPSTSVSAKAIGGLVGNAVSGSIDKSLAANLNIFITTGPLDASTNTSIGLWGIGGLVGVNKVNITNSAALNDVAILVNSDPVTRIAATSNSYILAGGFIGLLDTYATSNLTIDNNFASNFTSARFLGMNQSQYSYTKGFIGAYNSANPSSPQSSNNTSATIINNKSLQADISVATQANINKLSQDTYTALGWDFTNTFAIASNANKGLPYLQWAKDMFVPATPTPTPTPELTPVVIKPVIETNKDVDKVITSITNQQQVNVKLPTIVTDVKIANNIVAPSINSSSITNNSLSSNNSFATNMFKKLDVTSGESLSLVSTPVEGVVSEKITMNDLQSLKNSPASDSNNVKGSSEVRVSLGNGSIVELVNGGVTLPIGVEQEFYVQKTDSKNNNGAN